MLRDPLWVWQAVTVPAAPAAQTSYVRKSRLVTYHENFFDIRDTVIRVMLSERRLPALESNAANEPAVESFVCYGGQC